MRSSRDELSECIRSSQPKREDAKKAKVRKGFLGDIFATFASSRLALRLRRSRSRCFVVQSDSTRNPGGGGARRSSRSIGYLLDRLAGFAQRALFGLPNV